MKSRVLGKPVPRTRMIEVDPFLHTFKEMVKQNVRASGDSDQDRDLNQRQLSVFLIVGLEEGEHTVRGLAAELNISKPAITRALDRLSDFDYVKRNQDPADRRSVIVTRTETGTAYLRSLSRIAKQVQKTASRPVPVSRREREPVSRRSEDSET